jgi:hypothetical protein
MQNIVVHVVLPEGLALKDGSTLQEDTSFLLTDQVSPWYASVDQAKLEGGIYLTKVPEITMAAQIWNASKNADALSGRIPIEPPPGTPIDSSNHAGHQYFLFTHARNNWVALRAALDCIYNVFDLAGVRGSKTLGNFSVTRMSFARDESLPKKVRDMEDELKKWKIVLQSGGDIGFGGHARAGFGAKGKYDPSDTPPGRLWDTSGMGANLKTSPGWGSEGKPVRYGTPTFVNYRVGRYFAGYITVFPKFIFT